MTPLRRPWPTAVACAVLLATACSGGEDGADIPDGPRDAAEAVALVNDAVAGKHGEPDAEAARLYAAVAADHLEDFARPSAVDEPARLEGGRLAVGSGPAARFLALGMADAEGRRQVRSAHAAAGLDVAVSGLTAEQAGEASDWEERLGKLDAIVAGGEILGRDLPDSDANEVTAASQDAEDRTVVAAHLIVALRADTETGAGADADTDTGVSTGPDTNGARSPGPASGSGLAAVVDVAEATLRADVLADIGRQVTGEFGESVAPDLPADLHDGLADDLDELREAFAGHEEYPVEAAMFTVFRSYDLHLEAALAGRGDG